MSVLRNTNFRNGGCLNLSNVAEIEVEKKQLVNRLLQKGDLILERSGGGPTQPVGRVVYFNTDDEFSFSNFTTRIRIKNPKETNNQYLWRFLNYLYISGVTETLQKQTTGIRNLNFSEYKELEIPLPPLSEQKRIVEKIEKLFAKVDEAIRLRTEALSTSAAILPSAVHQVFSRAKKEGWKYKTFGEIIEIDTIRNTKNNLPFVGMEDVESHSGNFIGSRDPKEVKSTTFHFDTRHVLYGKLRPYLNKVLLSNFEGHCSTEFLPLLPDNKFLVREWLTVWLRYEKTVDNIMGTNSGSRMPRANMDKVKEFKIPLPPISEQRKIVDYLDSLSKKTQELIFYQKFQLKDLEELKQSILHKAFNEGL